MKIVLLRHGEPDLPEFGQLRANEFHRWIETYNTAPLNTNLQPSTELIEIAKHCGTIVCSNLRRSIESAQMLGIQHIHYKDAIFREVELPYASFPSPKLLPTTWSVIYRILWYMSYSTNAESFSLARRRASVAAKILHNRAESDEAILHVGHSLFNSLIAKKLSAKGWQGSISIFSKHWEYSVYEYLK